MSVKKISKIALLCGTAIGMSTAVAQADDLSELRAQIEALQSQVNSIETAPVSTVAPGTSLLTFRRGNDATNVFAGNTDDPSGRAIPGNRGVTISVNPAADPVAPAAPTTEVTVSGYVKGDLIFDFDENAFAADEGAGADSFGFSSLLDGESLEDFRFHARQSRLRVRSKTQTAVGEFRTWLEGDFFSSASANPSSALRLRHAWGEWKFAENWTFGAGQTWSNYENLFTGADTVDFFGPAGLLFDRIGQVSLLYANGPFQVEVTAEEPNEGGGTNNPIPDFTGRVRYTTAGGSIFQVAGIVGLTRLDSDSSEAIADGITGSDDEFTYGIQGAFLIPIGDRLTFSFSAGVGDGSSQIDGFFQTPQNISVDPANPDLEASFFYSVNPTISFAASDTVTFNVSYGLIDVDNGDIVPGSSVASLASTQSVQSVHANVWWQPVGAFRSGLEVIYGNRSIEGGSDAEAVRIQWGNQFFF